MKNLILLIVVIPVLQITLFAQNGWFQQTSGTTEWLMGVSFTDANNGTAVGGNGTILRTTDGGENWVSQTSGTNNILYGVSFTDANNGTAVGDSVTIIRTIDGGGNWISYTSKANIIFRNYNIFLGVSFTDANNELLLV